jgi:hypothetical protein
MKTYLDSTLGLSTLREAAALDRETELLAKAGYFDADGNPRQDSEGKRIWAEVQRQLHPSH